MRGDDDNSGGRGELPSSSVAFGDPTIDRDALTDEEKRAVGPRRLSSSEWVLLSATLLVVASTVGAAVLSRGPALDEDAERSAVREVVLRHQLDEAARFVERGEAVFCVALFEGVDPTAEFLARFLDYDVLVLPVTRCHAGGDELEQKRAWLFSVGRIYWRWSGDVDVIAGARAKSRYTLEKKHGEWRIRRVEPLSI